MTNSLYMLSNYDSLGVNVQQTVEYKIGMGGDFTEEDFRTLSTSIKDYIPMDISLFNSDSVFISYLTNAQTGSITFEAFSKFTRKINHEDSGNSDSSYNLYLELREYPLELFLQPTADMSKFALLFAVDDLSTNPEESVELVYGDYTIHIVLDEE